MTDTIKLIIAGSRDFSDYELLEKEVDSYLQEILKEEHDISVAVDGEGSWGWVRWSLGDAVGDDNLPLEIISGGARGADRLGEKYAKKNNLAIKIFEADWGKYKKSAGYIRNEEMAKYSNYAIIFNIGRSPGSVHMENLAKKYKLGLKVINL